MQNRNLKWHAAAIAAIGFVTLGALAAAIGQEQTATATGTMSIGGTATSTTAATTPATMSAAPTMKATKPHGF
jgi:hypothetical protein